MVKLGLSVFVKLETLCGVPQDSGLGSILFSTYVSDLPSVVKYDQSKPCCANDTQFYKRYKPTECNGLVGDLNRTLAAIMDWSKKNGLGLNVINTKLMWTGAQRLIKMTYGDVDVVKAVQTVRNLGLIMNQYLSFEKHVLARIGFGQAKLKFLWQFRNVLITSIEWNY